MKKLISMALAMTLVLLLMAGLGGAFAAATDPAAAILEGRYVYSFYAEGYGEYVFYFHFYPEAPVIGSVFYAGFANNGMKFTGTYTIEPIEKAYACKANRDEAIDDSVPLHEGVAPYTVTFYDFAGNVIDSCAFDGEILYNDMTTLTASGSSPLYYNHDTDPASKFTTSYEAETGVKYLEFVSPEDETSTITLFHNGTYLDLMTMFIEGAWVMEESADGYTYALTPNDPTDTAAVLTVSADTKTGAYTAVDEDPIDVVTTATEAAAVLATFTGIQTLEAYGTDGALTLSVYDNGTASLEMDVFGNAAPIDQGTYTQPNSYTFEFTFDNSGAIVSEIDFETTVITLHYTGEVQNIGAIDAVLTLQREAQ